MSLTLTKTACFTGYNAGKVPPQQEKPETQQDTPILPKENLEQDKFTSSRIKKQEEDAALKKYLLNELVAISLLFGLATGVADRIFPEKPPQLVNIGPPGQEFVVNTEPNAVLKGGLALNSVMAGLGAGVTGTMYANSSAKLDKMKKNQEDNNN